MPKNKGKNKNTPKLPRTAYGSPARNPKKVTASILAESSLAALTPRTDKKKKRPSTPSGSLTASSDQPEAISEAFVPPSDTILEDPEQHDLLEDDDDMDVEIDDVRSKILPSSIQLQSLDKIFSEADAKLRATQLFQWLIHPVSVADFFQTYWEKKPLHIRRNKPDFYQQIFSSQKLDQPLKQNKMEYGKHIDVTNYIDEERTTLNKGTDVAQQKDIWDMFTNQGASLRVYHPQEFDDEIYKMCASLQEFFNCVVGCNIYLTPGGSAPSRDPKYPWHSFYKTGPSHSSSSSSKDSGDVKKANQGFAPHYDDVDVFILQLEGRKHWELFAPTPEQSLPRYSSGNLERDEIGEPFKKIALEQGDFLYFPRGIIHQAFTDQNLHSMHATISTMQRWTYRDYLAKAIPAALEIIFQDDISFRKALPIDMFDFMGAINSDHEDERRALFEKKIKGLFSKLLQHIPYDAAADQMAVDFLHDSLPAYIVDTPLSCTIDTLSKTAASTPSKKAKRKSLNKGNTAVPPDPADAVNLFSRVRLVSPSSSRIVLMDEAIYFHYNTQNTRNFHEVPPKYLDFPPEAGPALEFLFDSYPDWIPVSSLPGLDHNEDKLEVARVLFSAGTLQMYSMNSFTSPSMK